MPVPPRLKRLRVSRCRFVVSDQIRSYIEDRTARLAGVSVETADRESDTSLSALPAEQYIAVMSSTPSLKEMTRNPFVLRLFVDVLPSMVASGLSLRHITRYRLYNAFVTQWFTREVARKGADEQASLGVVDGDASAVIDMFELLCALLALEMLKANVLSVVLASGSADSVIWRDVKDAADEWLSGDTTAIAAQQAKYDALSRREKAR